MSEGHYMRLSIRCPHCGSKTVAEDHKHIDRTADMITFRCKNHMCCLLYTSDAARRRG